MYSPKIPEDLVPRIHKTASEAGVPMTVWVNRALEAALANREPTEEGGQSDVEHPVARQ